MGNFLLHVAVFVTLVTCYVTVVESCRCIAPDPYEEVCKSDFAINATVLSENITYPEGSEKQPWDSYDVRYELDIHNVFGSASPDAETIPRVLNSYGPESLCGLSLTVGTTYILTGNEVVNQDTGERMIGMMLCNFKLYVNGPWGSDNDYVERQMKNIDCSAPPTMDNDMNQDRRDSRLSQVQNEGQKERKSSDTDENRRETEKADMFRAFLDEKTRGELANGYESFASVFTRRTHKNLNKS